MNMTFISSKAKSKILFRIFKIFKWIWHSFHQVKWTWNIHCFASRKESLTSVTVLCSWARHIYPRIVLVQPRKTHPNKKTGSKESNQTNKQNQERKYVISFQKFELHIYTILMHYRGFFTLLVKKITHYYIRWHCIPQETETTGAGVKKWKF